MAAKHSYPCKIVSVTVTTHNGLELRAITTDNGGCYEIGKEMFAAISAMLDRRMNKFVFTVEVGFHCRKMVDTFNRETEGRIVAFKYKEGDVKDEKTPVRSRNSD